MAVEHARGGCGARALRSVQSSCRYICVITMRWYRCRSSSGGGWGSTPARRARLSRRASLPDLTRQGAPRARAEGLGPPRGPARGEAAFCVRACVRAAATALGWRQARRPGRAVLGARAHGGALRGEGALCGAVAAARAWPGRAGARAWRGAGLGGWRARLRPLCGWRGGARAGH